jgi:hypothetical protein
VNASFSQFLLFEDVTEQSNNPSKRMADPLEMAKPAVYLPSDGSAYVVGADFLIDGGVTAISGVGAPESRFRESRPFRFSTWQQTSIRQGIL